MSISSVPLRGFAGRGLPVAALGLIGVAALAAMPLPPGLSDALPELAGQPRALVAVLLMVNPALLVLAGAALGAALAHRCGLGSLVAGTARLDRGGSTARELATALAVGLALGVVLVLADRVMLSRLDPAGVLAAAAAAAGPEALVASMLYGGLAEEVMLRWGAMSLFAAGLLALLGSGRRAIAVALASVAAALVFGLGHLPALAAQVDATPAWIARTLLLNGVAGLVYGELFRRHHLEAAMVAHAATHVGMWIARVAGG